MAASVLPRIIVSPLAGVVVDRFDRRRLMIWMDAFRVAAVVAVGIGAFAGFHFNGLSCLFSAGSPLFARLPGSSTPRSGCTSGPT